MKETYSIAISTVISEFGLQAAYLPQEAEKIMISNAEVSRPGLALTGFFELFDPSRVQILGRAEYRYLEKLEESRRNTMIDDFFRQSPAAVIMSTNLSPFPCMLEAAEKYSVPLLITHEKTSPFMAALIAFLNVQLAPRITRHGVLVEVYGEGILLLGESGVGKSETAIELVKRGHQLVADDAVVIKRTTSTNLVGTAPELIRYFIELRGIGIINVRRIFGIGAVKVSEDACDMSPAQLSPE